MPPCMCVCVEPQLRDFLFALLPFPFVLLLCFKPVSGGETCGHLVVIGAG